MVTGIGALLVGMLGAAPAARAHPLHSTLTTIAWHDERRLLDVAVRVFTQDLADAAGGAVSDSAACGYATSVFSIRDAAGRALHARTCAIERVGDVTWIRLDIPAPSPTGLKALNAFLFERFPDQINIVQANLAGRARTILFTSGDGPKPLS